MGKRYPNPRRVKIHHNYSVDETARLLKVHKNTVRRWIKDCLETIDTNKPFLILGSKLRSFLETKRKTSKRPCPPGFMFCFRCREPKTPVDQRADLVQTSISTGNLRGTCPACLSVMYRRVSMATLADSAGNLTIAQPEASLRIVGPTDPSSNDHFDTDQEHAA